MIKILEQVWQSRYIFIGADLEVEIQGYEMVASPDKQFLFTIGNKDDKYDKDIYKFSCSESINDCKWTKWSELKYGREYPVAFPIPDDLVNKLCNWIWLWNKHFDLSNQLSFAWNHQTCSRPVQDTLKKYLDTDTLRKMRNYYRKMYLDTRHFKILFKKSI